MKDKLKVLPLLLAFPLIFTACGGNDLAADSGSSVSSGETSSAIKTETAKDSKDMFTNRDYEVGYDETTAVHIELKGDSISCDSNAVQIDGTTATITGRPSGTATMMTVSPRRKARKRWGFSSAKI